MALGARPVQVMRLVLGSISRSVMIGIVIGFVSVIGASRLLVMFLFGVSPLDPLAYAQVVLILAAAGAGPRGLIPLTPCDVSELGGSCIHLYF